MSPEYTSEKKKKKEKEKMFIQIKKIFDITMSTNIS